MHNLNSEFGVVIVIFLYFIPTYVAGYKNHESFGGIFFLNLILGWTLIGWIVVFYWSFSNQKKEIINTQTSKSDVDEIIKLSDLKKQGLLTDDEFSKAKQKILKIYK